VAVKVIEGLLDFLGKMGLTLRGDPPRKIDVTHREWGEPADGVVLSIREIPRDEPEQLFSVSAVMKNSGQKQIPLEIPGWLYFYQIEIEATPTPYGRSLLRPKHHKEPLRISLGPGDATETDIPIGSIYELRPGNEYKLKVTCRLPEDILLTSNELTIRS
jgi:hypothetical protein